MAADKAADAQGDAADSAAASQAQSLAFQREMYEQNREDMAPWRDTGENALNRLWYKTKKGPGSFRKSPGYKFAFEQGVNALDRSAAARGRLNSGAQDKALTRYGQGMANQEYDNFLNRYYQSLTPYQSLAGVGQTATSTTANMGQNAANSIAGIYNNIGNTQLSAGDARASGYINQGNVMSNLANQAGQGMAWYAGQNQFPAFNSPASAQTGNYGPVQGG
jgi:hypothetical protein